MRSVRDFIYLDSARVRSFSSQLFEGVSENVRREHVGAHHTEGRDAQFSSIASSELRLVEERVLLDHVYNQLEDEVRTSMLTIEAGVDLARLRQHPLVRATGNAEIEDYRRFDTVLTAWNTMAVALASLTFRPKHHFKSLKERDKALREHAETTGNALPDDYVASLRKMGELLNPNAFYVVCTLPETTLMVRAVLDRRWLRYDEQMLSSLYAGESVVPWTFVGQVTYAPGGESDREDDVEPTTLQGDGTPDMAAIYRKVFRAMRFMEKSVSRSTRELIMSPFAIYREFTLADSEQ